MYDLKDFTFDKLHTHKINRNVDFSNLRTQTSKTNIAIDETENIIAFRLKSKNHPNGISLCDIINFCLIVSQKTPKKIKLKERFSYPKKLMHKLALISLDIIDYEKTITQK